MGKEKYVSIDTIRSLAEKHGEIFAKAMEGDTGREMYETIKDYDSFVLFAVFAFMKGYGAALNSIEIITTQGTKPKLHG